MSVSTVQLGGVVIADKTAPFESANDAINALQSIRTLGTSAQEMLNAYRGVMSIARGMPKIGRDRQLSKESYKTAVAIAQRDAQDKGLPAPSRPSLGQKGWKQIRRTIARMDQEAFQSRKDRLVEDQTYTFGPELTLSGADLKALSSLKRVGKTQVSPAGALVGLDSGAFDIDGARGSMVYGSIDRISAITEDDGAATERALDALTQLQEPLATKTPSPHGPRFKLTMKGRQLASFIQKSARRSDDDVFSLGFGVSAANLLYETAVPDIKSHRLLTQASVDLIERGRLSQDKAEVAESMGAMQALWDQGPAYAGKMDKSKLSPAEAKVFDAAYAAARPGVSGGFESLHSAALTAQTSDYAQLSSRQEIAQAVVETTQAQYNVEVNEALAQMAKGEAGPDHRAAVTQLLNELSRQWSFGDGTYSPSSTGGQRPDISRSIFLTLKLLDTFDA